MTRAILTALTMCLALLLAPAMSMAEGAANCVAIAGQSDGSALYVNNCDHAVTLMTCETDLGESNGYCMRYPYLGPGNSEPPMNRGVRYQWLDCELNDQRCVGAIECVMRQLNTSYFGDIRAAFEGCGIHWQD